LPRLAPAIGSSGDPTAVASKSKCKKKARWKCAAKRFHLSADGFYGYNSGSQTFHAEIDLRKRRASTARSATRRSAAR
jgi:hypothetical protein